MQVYMYYIIDKGEPKIILILYVDDLLFLGKDQSGIADVKHQLGDLYHMKDLGPTSSYLRIRITRGCKSRSIWIDQQVYIDNTIKRFRLQNANNMKTLLPVAIHLEKYDGTATTETKTLFQQMIGTLIYATIGMRPNITFSATRLSWYNNNPSDSHVKYVKHVLRYLQGTKELHIKYNGSSTLDWLDIQTWIEVRTKTITTSHQDPFSWWQTDVFLGHHNDKKQLEDKLLGSNPSVERQVFPSMDLYHYVLTIKLWYSSQ